ncbi:hypothetical protein DRO37_08105 [Candidatus Bathyarchaeota archaeon]|nr:MAG: hypothetical protein DRO37_08105 [Candidatus Bathyarchaeota archaeon]
MNAEGIEIEDSSLGLILLGIITALALFTSHGIAVYALSLLAFQLFKNELKSVVYNVFGKRS